VRYASAYGKSDEGYLKYKYCAGIKQQARLSGFFLNLQNSDIAISYDTGPSGTSLGNCDASTGEDTDIGVDTEDRVTVTVSATYNPILSLLPLGTRTFTASSSRTILGVHELDN
jgi:hypothetical protein